MEKVIEVKNLNFNYFDGVVFKNAEFSIDKGDYVGIIGPNGSGKSTLVKLLLGILSPQSGEIKLFGEPIEKIRNWNRIGYVSQKANSFNTSFPATVEEVVSSSLAAKIGFFKPFGKIHREQVMHALELVGMDKLSHKMIGNLSGGQQQKVFIARALVNQPEILFLDEPTVGVDAKSEDALYCLLAKLNKDLGITMVMVSHDIGAVTVHANKVACMENNSIIVHDPKDEIGINYIKEMYGYQVNLHVHKHDCDNLAREE